MKQQERALRLAAGSYQRALVQGYETLGGSTLRGRARRYSGRYRQSAYALLARLDAAGVEYQIEPGPRGGWYNSRLVFSSKEG
jgi:hypothetical protein